jgi:hypothetical protein
MPGLAFGGDFLGAHRAPALAVAPHPFPGLGADRIDGRRLAKDATQPPDLAIEPHRDE